MSFSRIFERFRDASTSRRGRLPKRIYSLWIQGESSAPDLVRLNWDRWSKLNPEYELIILDRAAALERIGPFPIDPGALSHQAFSDVLRARLLSETGGVWADASVLPIVPLSQWLEDCVPEHEFFAYAAPGLDRPIASWFLAARDDSLIMQAWWDALLAYWCKPRSLLLDERGTIVIPANPAAAVAPNDGALHDRYYYFWFHYLFAHLIATTPAVREVWAQCCRKPASAPHRLQGLLRGNPNPPATELEAEAHTAEMQKLDWRASYPLDLLKPL